MADLTARLDGIVHEPTQVHDRGVDLTVAEVYAVEGAGHVDFGGSKLAEAVTAPVETDLRRPDDDYGWWSLDAGNYLLAYNESLAGEEPVVVQTRDAVRERGAFHPTLHVADLERVPFAVGGAGIRLKENARVSTALAP